MNFNQFDCWDHYDYHAQFALARLCSMFGWRFATG